MLGWRVVGLFGAAATVGAFIGGYVAASAAAPEGCKVSAFDEGIFTYFCEDPLRIESVGFEVTGIAIFVGAVAGFLAWMIYEKSNPPS